MFSEELQRYASKKYFDRREFLAPIWEELELEMDIFRKEERVLMQFLYGTMPIRDAGEYESSLFLRYVRHALFLRKNVSWCRELPEDIFLHHVLYYRINSENITDCREFFYEQLKDRIAGMDIKDAVLEINYWCAEHMTYEAADMRTASPMTSYRSGKGRCGEESTFAVTAYRSVGIPARQVYTPRWAHCDDNHAWVEVYFDGCWHFLGACEPEQILNKGWFTEPANRAILIHSRTFSGFGDASGEECIGKEDLLTYYNNTSFYAKTKKLTVTVKDTDGNPVPGASVSLEILNMAEFFPSAVMISDENGQVSITIGIGTVHIRVEKEELFGEIAVPMEQAPDGEDVSVEAVLSMRADQPDWVTDRWEQEELAAPMEHPIHTAKETEEQKQENERRLKAAAEERERRFERFYQEACIDCGAGEEKMLRTAGENYDEIALFLKKDANPDRKRLLRTLAVKDYKDLKADILEDHLNCCSGGISDEIYEKYLLCPRIYFEEMTPYRGFIRSCFSGEQLQEWSICPEKIWEYIKANISYSAKVDYKTICATPIGCLKMRQGNPLSQKILFVAICRTIGIPARINTATLDAEYFQEGAFTAVGVSGEGEPEEEKAILRLIGEDESKWTYFQTWTIGKLEGTHYQTLDYEGVSFVNPMELSLTPGIYRLITTVRLPNGNQRVSTRVFSLEKGGQKEITLELFERPMEELLVNEKLTDLVLTDTDGKETRLSALTAKKPAILGFLGVGAEPTEHVLNEMCDMAVRLNEMNVRVLLVLRKKEELSNATLRRTRALVNGIRIYYGNEDQVKVIADQMNLNPEKLPVLTVVKQGLTGVYGCAGYNVGSVGFMVKLLEK